MSLPGGRLESLGDEGWLGAVLKAFETQDTSRSSACELSHEGQRAYLKFGPLRGKHRLRHGLRALLPGQRVPRLQEFENLIWLREHGFGAPRPLVAGALRRAGLPAFQFLATEFVEDSSDLRSLCEGQRGAGLPLDFFLELGCSVRRLHELGFTHRDLYPRNLLLSPESGSKRVAFIDSWRGGPRRGLRGPEYDLACFLLFAPLLFDEAQTSAFLRAYFAAGATDAYGAALKRVLHLRRLLVRQLSQRQRTRHALPPLDWRPAP